MTVVFVAHVAVVIRAPRSAVWAALVGPETIGKIMPVEVVSPWRAGEAFVWMVEMLGKPYRVDGVVHRFEADQLLEYEYVDPHTLAFENIESRHRVTIELSDDVDVDVDGTRISLTHDNNRTNAELSHAEGGWRLALHNLKAVIARDRSPS